MTATLDGDPDSATEGWEAQFHARHVYLFFIHLIVTEEENQGQSFHHIRWNVVRTVPWSLGVFGLGFLVAIVPVLRMRRRKK